MIYYLAGPIDFVSSKESWKDELKRACDGVKYEIVLFDPDTYFFTKLGKQTSEYIHDVNMFAIERADALVVRWMKGQISVGTPMELYYAVQKGKYLILITDMADVSVYINFVASFGVVVPDMHSAFSAMCQFEENPAHVEREKVVRELVKSIPDKYLLKSSLDKAVEKKECIKNP